MKNKSIILREFEPLSISPEKGVIRKTLDDLKAFVTANEEMAQYFKPGFKKGLGDILTAQNYVGVIQTKDGTTIEILPKIPDDQAAAKTLMLKMLKTLKDSPFKNLNTANLKSCNMPLLEIFITMFLDELEHLIKQGIKSDYVLKCENLKFLKGKFIIGEQIKQNYIHKERFFVEYEDYSVNRPANRLIKTCIEFLYKRSRDSKNQQRLRQMRFIFDEVPSSKDVKTDFKKVKYSRLINHYEKTLLWSKVFLQGESFTPIKGNHVAFALLYDMNLLFESFVSHWLKINIKKQDPNINIKTQDAQHHLAYSGENKRHFKLKPDIVFNNGEVIADTKWKILSAEKSNQGVSQADMYQLFAYGKKYNSCQQLYLIYPTKNDNIEDDKKQLEAIEYDLAKNCNDDLRLNIIFFNVDNINDGVSINLENINLTGLMSF